MSGKNATERLRADDAGIARAAQILRAGGLVALPTETVYGLAARADRAQAVASIYAAKRRPSFNPLIVHVPDMGTARRLAEWDERAGSLAGDLWPGPLTMVLPHKSGTELAPAVTAGLGSVALRCPAHPVMRAVLRLADVPLAAPSANLSETVSPTQADHVLATLDNRIDAVLDAGPCEQGLESTIVALDGVGEWSILRPGPIPQSRLEDILGRPPTEPDGGIRAPGMLARHYAPGKPVRLNAKEPRSEEYFLGFGPVRCDWSLSESGDLAEAAARLYAGLHLAASSDRPRIAVAQIPDEGLGCAINDRLRRAAA